MKASTIKQINDGGNTSNASNPLAGSSLPARSPFEGLNFLGGTGNTSGASSSNIPGGGINPFAGDAGSEVQQLISDRLKLVLGNDYFKDTNKALANGSNPFAGSKPITNAGSPPFNASNAPVGNGNKNFGKNNATVGNFNSDYGSESATIGNGNWNFNKDNATIGNGNWQFGKSNTTLGNGNWYWDDGSNNATLGNGNWHFGSDNATIGNGNWDFGSNNTVVGNGNWILTSGNTVVGNGNRLVDSDNTTIGVGKNTSSLEPSSQELKADVDSLINSLTGKIGQNFIELTGNLGASETETFNRLILSKGNGTNDGNISTDINQLLASIKQTQGNAIYQPVHSESVPEPGFSASLIVVGVLYLLLSKLKKRGLKIQ